MSVIIFLIIFPLFIALLLLLLKKDFARTILVRLGVVSIIVGTLVLFVMNFRNEAMFFKLESTIVDKIIFLLEVSVGGYIFWLSLRLKKHVITLLITLQLLISIILELTFAHQVTIEHNLFVDKLSMIMALIIGIIGGLICLYALGYMKEFNEHNEKLRNKSPFFFFLLFLFLSAMFGVVFSNNIVWLYFFWEITTLCSFLLIGYKGTEEATNNAFKALTVNLLGGLAFAIGIAYLYVGANTIELDKVIASGKTVLILVPVIFICFAGLTKSAQFPFASWLLGAMVAPTPVSALLHSSTMVKAGVYIIVRFASLLNGTLAGFTLATIGGLTFLLGSLIAITQEDAKRVLAYSTIANLGLIVLCAGVGTNEAVWAAILLIIFHAISKCLLFLCVGIIEHKLHTRDIDEMSSLIIKMPKLSIMMQIGMAGMFLAPFGMLISKWAVLRAVINYNALFAIFVVFGSAATLFFWVKWIGKLLIATNDKQDSLEKNICVNEWITLYSLSGLTIGVCCFLPLLSSKMIEPYLLQVYGKAVSMSHGNIIIMLIMLSMMLIFPLSFLSYGKNVKEVDAYLGGANADSSSNFIGAVDEVKNLQINNYYLDKYFGEKRIFKYGIGINILLIIVMIISCYL